MDYTDWNLTIARYFFNPSMAGKEILLFVNEEKINDLGSPNKANVSDFIDALKKDSELSDNVLCKRALRLYKDWRQKESEYPPYIAYLALFVLASTTQGNFDEKAYYPRYWKLIGTPGQGAPDSFYDTAKLWDDLAQWSVEDKKEELGRFTAKIRGSWRHVGRPLSQTLLSDDERDSLAKIFFDCGFDPSNIPSEAIVKKGLLRHGGNLLRHRTLELLRSQSGENEEFVNSLLNLVITELEQWGRYEVTTPDEPEIATKKQHPEHDTPTPSLFLRACIDLDTTKQQTTLSLRLKTTRHYPEDGLEFEVNGQTLFCSETVPAGWSTKLIETSTNKPFDSAKFDWSKNWKFAAENGWTATYKSQDIRLFRPGAEEDLPGVY